MLEHRINNGQLKNGEEGRKWTKALLAVMKKNIGGFVVHPMKGMDNTITNDTIYIYPKRVGIIINEGNGSSAEQFILNVQNNANVTLLGNSILDYSNAVPESLPLKNV